MASHPLGHYMEIVTDLLGSPPVALLDPDKPLQDEVDYSSDIRESLIGEEWLKSTGHMPRFTFLSEPIQQKLIVAYIKWIHPQLPVLDLANFLAETLNEEETTIKESLLYKAVLFAGTFFVDQNTIREAGYASKDLMAANLAAEVKYLYNIGSESKNISKLQAFLLMTYWHEIFHENEADQGFWLGLAHKIAEKARIFPPFNQSRQGNFNRRLWACLYLRDSLVSLATRRPSILKAPELPIIHKSDLGCSETPLEVKKGLPQCCRKFLGVKFESQTQMLFLQKIDLCVCINSILSRMFGFPFPECNDSGNTTALNLAPLRPTPAQAAQECYDLLHDWITSPGGGTYFDLPSPFLAQDAGSTETVIRVYQADVNLLYLTASATFFSCLRSSSCQAQKTLEYISKDIMQTISDLRDAKLDRYIQPTAITALLCATFTHLSDSASTQDRNASSLMLRKCADIAQWLISLYPKASLVSRFCSIGLEN